MNRNYSIVPLVSFPKSGNTWVRFLLANLLKKDKNQLIDFNNINDFMPTSHNENFEKTSSLFIDNAPIFVKEHVNYYEMPRYQFDKAIYIYRNGFDALYSYWHFSDAQSPGLYKDIEVFSTCYWHYCGHWGNHLYSWMLDPSTQKKHTILSINYERLIREPFAIVKEIVEFLNLKVDDKHIQEAIEASDKKNMKKMSGSSDFMKSKKKDFHFVRSATQGDSNTKLPENCKIKFLENNLNYDLMLKFGYLDVNSVWASSSKKQHTPLIDKVKCFYNYYKYRLKEKLYT